MVHMAAIINPHFSRKPRTVRLTLNLIYLIVTGVMALVGVACTLVALAAGAQSTEVLAMVFFMGASGALCLLIVWYLLQLRPR